jgi:hypothetical protein
MADNIIHETNRNTKTARATQNPGDEAVAKRSRYSPDGSNGGGITQFCSSLEGCIQKRRKKSSGKQAASVKTVQTVRQAVIKTSKTSFERPKSQRLQNRLMDTPKDRTDNKKTLWPILSAFRSLVYSSSDWLELSETRKESQRTQQAGHRILAKEGLASYKKKPAELSELPYWLMKAALCCNRQSGGHGHLRDKRPFNIAGIEETVSRPFPRSAFRLNAIDWACTFLFKTAMSGWMILKRLYRCCWNIFQKVLSWFSTAGWFIAGQKEDCVRGLPNVSISNGFQPMPRSLIRSSRFGITANTANLPTTFLTMYLHLKKRYVSLSSIFVHKKPCYIHSLKKLDLKYDSFH